jgi:MFS transporter, DHA1 family, tetracycline resistance protein
VPAAPGPSAHARHSAAVSLYAAGFTTAFGAHSIAANLGGYTGARHEPLLVLGVLLAVYDGAEVALKPVFGALADRTGPRPVLLGGLAAFAVFSAAFALAGDPALVGVARFGQGAAAAAFSPAAGAPGPCRRGQEEFVIEENNSPDDTAGQLTLAAAWCPAPLRVTAARG